MLDSKLLGKRIQKYRRIKKWSAEKFAEIIDVSVPYIRELERGAKTPSMKMFVKIANELNVTADELLCDSVKEDTVIITNELNEKLNGCSAEKMRVICSVIESLVKEL